MLQIDILYFAWEDQSEKVCCIAHKVGIPAQIKILEIPTFYMLKI